jgi:hypothetical protein
MVDPLFWFFGVRMSPLPLAMVKNDQEHDRTVGVRKSDVLGFGVRNYGNTVTDTAAEI